MMVAIVCIYKVYTYILMLSRIFRRDDCDILIPPRPRLTAAYVARYLAIGARDIPDGNVRVVIAKRYRRIVDELHEIAYVPYSS